MSLNLFGIEDWEAREPKISAYVQREQPDVILFQEVVYLPEISPFNQVQLLNRTLGYAYEHSAVTRLQRGVDYPVYREGLAVLSRFPITRSDTLALKQAADDPLNRIIQLVDVDCDGTVWRLANVHFAEYLQHGYGDKNSALHLAETLEILKARGEQRVIVGDFNMPDVEKYANLWGDAYLSSSATPYISYPQDNIRVDYALVPKNYRLQDINVSPDGLSDHRALMVAIAPT